MNGYAKLVLTMLCLFSHPILGFRCKNIPINGGDSKEDVYDACGEPDKIDSWMKTRRILVTSGIRSDYGYGYPRTCLIQENNVNEVEVFVEKWTYYFRRGGIPKATVFEFENDQLTRISKSSRFGRRH